MSICLSDEAVQELARSLCESETAPDLMPPQAAMLLEILAEHGEREAMDTLLERKWVPPHASVLAALVVRLDGDDDEETFQRLAPAVALLLRHGADALTPQPDDPASSSPADLIHHNIRLEEYLRAQGITVGRTPRRLREKPTQLADDLVHLPRHAHPPAEDLCLRFDAMTSLLHKPAACGWVAEMAPMRVPPLLAQADPERAAEVIMALPAWQEAEGDKLDYLCCAVLLARRMTLPPDWILATAVQLHGRHQEFAAHEILSLLGRDTQAAALVEELCADTRPALAAAAWGARLRLAGLSASQLHSFYLAFPRGKLHARALRMFGALVELGAGTFYESGFRQLDIAVGHPKARDLAELLALLREYGQDAAADTLAELDALRRLGKRRRTSGQTARLAELTGDEAATATSFGVEIAVAQFLHAHRHQFCRYH